MEIKNNPLFKATSAYAKTASNAKKADEEKKMTAKTDTLELSNDSPRNLHVSTLVKEATAQVDAPASESKIAALKEQFAMGTYKPDAKNIAKAMLGLE